MKNRRKSESRKTKRASIAKSRRIIAATTSITDGLTVIAIRTSIRIIDHRQDKHTLKAGESLSFRPVPVAAGELAHTEIPGFRQAPPSSVLWLDISGDRDKNVSIMLDAGGLLRNAARWGRPAILAYTSSGRVPSRWTVVGGSQKFALEAGAHLLIIGVGHGVSVDPASVFSSLLQAAAVHRRKASKRGDRANAE